MMKLSDKHKKLLILAVLVVVAIVMFKLMYSPFFTDLRELRVKVERLEKEYNSLLAKSSQVDKLIDRIYEKKLEISDKTRDLPPNLLQERVIILLRDLQYNTGMKLNSITFSNPIPIENLKFNTEKEYSDSYKKEDTKKKPDEAKKAEPEDISRFPENSVLRMEVRANFNCNYIQLKDFLSAVEVANNRIVVSNLSVAGEGVQLSGNITMMLWGFINKDKILPDWDIELDIGKSNPFSSLGVIDLIY